MRYLLDTHTLIWSLQEPGKLSKTAIEKITRTTDSTIYTSIISLWEIALKISIGKGMLVGITIEQIPPAIAEMGVHVLSLDEKSCILSAKLPFKPKHRDPFHRIIICQAIEHDMTLISKDEELGQYAKEGLKTIW